MEWISHYDLFLFDFDGLLVNTEQLHYQAYANMCRNRGFSLPWDFSSYCAAAHGESWGLEKAIYAEFPKLFEKEPNWKVLYAEKQAEYFSLLTSGKVEYMPGVSEMLTILEKKGKRRCVVTNSGREPVALIKKALPQLNTIPHWVTREEYLEPKPHPECYLTAIARYGKKGDRIVGFEDTMKGLKALLQSPAIPFLITSLAQPELESLEGKVFHYSSFEEIAKENSSG